MSQTKVRALYPPMAGEPSAAARPAPGWARLVRTALCVLGAFSICGLLVGIAVLIARPAGPLAADMGRLVLHGSVLLALVMIVAALLDGLLPTRGTR